MAAINPLEGTSLPYRKEEDLNSGSFGVVHRCLHLPSGQQVAIRWIERGNKITRYVEQEVVNHRILYHHPYVVQFRELLLTPKFLGIVMEYAEGGDLFGYAVTQHRRLTEGSARRLFQQLIVALDFCHRKAVVNRDIKLENILLGPGGPPSLKLCDFGYSKNWQMLSAPKSKVGTGEYLAPEVIACAATGGAMPSNGMPADVWSSGVTLYTMLTGSYPFSRPSDRFGGPALAIQLVEQRIRALDYSIPDDLTPEISQPCQDLLRRILVVDPDQRITIDKIFQDPWFKEALDPELLGLNDRLVDLPLPAHLQTEAQIRAVLERAKLAEELNQDMLNGLMDEAMDGDLGDMQIM